MNSVGFAAEINKPSLALWGSAMDVEGAPQHVDLDGFLGGPEDLELLAWLRRKATLQSPCIDSPITTDNVTLLHTASLFLEMSQDCNTTTSLQQTQEFLATMPFWSLSQCMSLLKSFDVMPHHADNTSIIQQCVDLISSKAASCSDTSTPTCFSPNSRHSSSDTSVSDPHSYTCVYEDITHLSIALLEKLMMAMISNHVDNKFLAKCLLHYLQTAKKRALSNHGDNAWSVMDGVPLETFERVVFLLHKLEWASMSCRSLFGLQRMATKLHASKACRKKIEGMVGYQLDKATLDDILVPRHRKDGTLYDVNLVLRLVKAFLRKQVDVHSVLEIGPVKRVGILLDKYLAEIAPDPNLTEAKFKAVADSLPDFARDSHDDLYQALDIYLEAHPRVQEDQVVELCKVIDFTKLSMETSKHVAQSLWFPARVTLQVLLQEQTNLKAAMGHHQHQILRKTGDASASSLSSAATLRRQGSNGGYKHTSHHDQQEKGLAKTHSLHVGHAHNHHNQHEDNVINSQLGSPSTIGCNFDMSKSIFAWDYSLHSQSNGSSKRSLYEQLALEEGEEQQDLEYRRILRQNEELRTDLHLMQSRVLALEKACGQMKTKVSKCMKTRPLLC